MVCKGRGIVCDEIGAGSRTTRLTIYVTSPVSAECHIENDLVVVETRCDIRTTAREIIVWYTPVCSCRISRFDVCRNVRSRELPYSDSGAAPVHGVDSAAAIVEAVSITCAETAVSPAAGIVSLSSGVDIAIQCVEVAGLLVGSDEGVGSRV